MSCCSPNYRKTVNEQEEAVNQKGEEKLPFFVKIIATIIIISGLLIVYNTY
jgi:hypothetical protein